MSKKKKNYIITIDGIQNADGYSSENINMSTEGFFEPTDGGYLISYEESEATGLPGNVTSLFAEGDRRVTMTRKGPEASQLIIERGRKHLCHYETGYGALTMGIYAEDIVNRLTEEGGSLKFKYRLDINSSALVTNELNVTVKEKKHV